MARAGSAATRSQPSFAMAVLVSLAGDPPVGGATSAVPRSRGWRSRADPLAPQDPIRRTGPVCRTRAAGERGSAGHAGGVVALVAQPAGHHVAVEGPVRRLDGLH